MGSGQNRGRVLQHVPGAVEVQGDDPHGLAHGDHRIAGLPGDPLRRPVPGTRLVGRQLGVGHQLHRGAHDGAPGAVHYDRAVHLGQLAQPGGRELHVQLEPAGAQRLDCLVVAEHDQCPGAAAQDPLQPVAQGRARRERGKGGAPPLSLPLAHRRHPGPGTLLIAVSVSAAGTPCRPGCPAAPAALLGQCRRDRFPDVGHLDHLQVRRGTRRRGTGAARRWAEG